MSSSAEGLDCLIHFAPVYRAMRERQCALREIGNCATKDLLKRSYSAMRFATTMLYEKVGTRNRRIPTWHRAAIEAALNGEFSNAHFSSAVQTPSFSNHVWRNFLRLATNKSGNEPGKFFEAQTRGAVKELLDALREGREPNLFKWLTRQNREPEDAHNALDELSGIGPKLASFVLREAAIFCGAWNGRINRANGWCFQPVDRWVLRWAKTIWPGSLWPDERQISDSRLQKRAANQIAGKFHDHAQHRAMEFNMSAWFLGAQFEKILAVHSEMYVGTDAISALPSKKLLQIVTRFEPNRIIESLRVSLQDL
jgi:hypothetical protein